MADYVPREYAGQKINLPKDYTKVVVESYDPNNIIYNYYGPYTGTNVKLQAKDWLWLWNAVSTASSFTLNQVLQVASAGDYRVEVFCFTTTSAHSIDLKFNGTSIRTPISVKARDRFFRKVDFGVHKLQAGTLNVSAVCGGTVEIATIYLKKIRKVTGDTYNNGQMVYYKSKANLGVQDSPDSLELTVKHENRPWSEGGFIEPGNSTGLVFEYRDPINFFANDETGTLRQLFGGYISSAIESQDRMKIEIKCAGRMKDGENKHILKEIAIGGSTADTDLLYNAADLYDALSYFAEAMELPLQNNNFLQLKNSIPSQKYYRVDYKRSGDRNAVGLRNMIKTAFTSNLGLRNSHVNGSTQWAILWDSGWNKRDEALGFDIKDKPVFFFEYGMGAAPVEGSFKVWVPKEYTPKTHKVKKGTGVYKTVKGQVGYDTTKPFKCYIEIQYSTTPTGTRIFRYIDFTETTSTSKMGSIVPIMVNNTKKVGEFNVGAYLDTNEPGSHYYLRRIALVYVAPSGDNLYDPSNDDASNKILLYAAGFREGTAILPELLNSSGKKLSELFKAVRDKLKLTQVMEYAEDRANDRMILSEEKSSGVLIEFKEGLDGNIAAISNITYPVINTLKNSVIKVYKTSDKTYTYVTYKVPSTLFRFGSHEDVEVLNDQVGPYYAQNLAKNDADINNEFSFTYTIELEGYYHVKMGQYVITTLDNYVYNDLQLIQSIEYEYDTDKRPMGRLSLGLGELSPEAKAKTNFRNIRRTVNVGKRRLFGGGAAPYTQTEGVDLLG